MGCLAFSGGEGQWTANGGYLGTLPGALHRFYGEGGRGGDLWGVESTHSADTGSDMRLIRGAAPREDQPLDSGVCRRGPRGQDLSLENS